MERTNVVVTCGGKWVGLILQFREALRRVPALRRGKLLVADCAPLTPAGCYADGVIVVPTARDPRFLERMLEACIEHNIRVVLPHTSLDMGQLAPHRARFADVGTTLVCTSPDLLDLVTDKQRFAQFATQEGLAQPRSFSADALEEAPFPLFAKRRRGYGSIGAGVCRSVEEARAALRRFPDLVFQEFIEAPEVTVDAYINLAGRCIVRVPRIRDKIVDGESVQAHTIRSAPLADLLDRTIAALAPRGLRGPLNLQAFAGERPVLIEVNARVGSGTVLGNAATGGRLFTALLQEACGQQADGDPDDYREGLALYRYMGDVFHDGTRPLAFSPPRADAC
jgi:carbamoyl-phosphate synthase large subunit